MKTSINSLDELIQCIMTQQSNNRTDPNWFMRELAPNDHGFSFLDFYGWTVALRTPWLEAPHIDSFDDDHLYQAPTIDPRVPPQMLTGPIRTVQRFFIHESVTDWLKKKLAVRDV